MRTMSVALLAEPDDGPSTMVEAMRRAALIVQKIPKESQQQMFNILLRVFTVSHYSGMDCWMLTLTRIMKALASELSVPFEQIHVTRMCEKDPAAQLILQGYGDHSCIFKDIDDMFHCKTVWSIGVHQPPAEASGPDALKAWQRVDQIMDDYLRSPSTGTGVHFASPTRSFVLCTRGTFALVMHLRRVVRAAVIATFAWP